MAADREAPDVPQPPADFSDPESERVLDATARALARELGRQAYRELTARKEVQPMSLSIQCETPEEQEALAEWLRASGHEVVSIVRQ